MSGEGPSMLSKYAGKTSGGDFNSKLEQIRNQKKQ